MDQLVQCPVCTLFLHNGMSLESHLDTHPKDQVIKALCSLSANKSNYGSRASTPMHSEHSFRSRSRTPAIDDNVRWNGGHGNDSERVWHRSFSRTPRPSHTRSATPAERQLDSTYDPSKGSNTPFSSSSYTHSSRIEKEPPQYPGTPLLNYDQYAYGREQKEEKEIKYSRSEEYNSLETAASGAYVYNMPAPPTPCLKLPNALLNTASKRNDTINLAPETSKHDFLKILPKSSSIALVKTNVGYLTPGVVMSSDSSYIPKHPPPSNLIVTTNLQNTSTMVQNKLTTPLSVNQYNQLTSSAFALPNTTVVTQNSQLVYRGMVHNIEGRSLVPGIPTVLSAHENITNVAQSSSIYQNVMVLDQFGNTTSCMYATPQLLPKPSTPMYNQTAPNSDKPSLDQSKTLIIEVSPMESQPSLTIEASVSSRTSTKVDVQEIPTTKESVVEKVNAVPELPSSNKAGLKILSNIKVEVPVQHHKSLLNKVVDLTGPIERDYPKRDDSPERILPDIDTNTSQFDEALNLPNENIVTNTFSVIKNIGNPSSYKSSKALLSEKLQDIESSSSNSFPVPDLICNEKPSISPCSELSDNGDNAVNNSSISKETPSSANTSVESDILPKEEPIIPVTKTYKSNPLRLNNIYVKKSKKVLQIKNSKLSNSSKSHMDNDAGPSRISTSPKSKSPKSSSSKLTSPKSSSPKFTSPKSSSSYHDSKHVEKPKAVESYRRSSKLETVSIDKIHDDDNDFDADTEEQSMDLELDPVTPTTYHPTTTNVSNEYSSIDLTRVKEEVNSSNDFSKEATISDRQFTDLTAHRAMNIVHYGSMSNDFDEDSSNRELLDLETAKTKHFVNMMNENYFGDNIYADYFTPDRVESFDNDRDTTPFNKDVPKDAYGLWGEPSQKESEFILPNFVHESYKIAESGPGGFIGGLGSRDDVENCRDNKADVLSDSRSDLEAPLNICADERMPPRGELSGQESNGDMDASWPGMYQEVTPSEPYDLMARESWVSDASDVDSNDKRDTIDEEMSKPRVKVGVEFSCGSCGVQLSHIKELRVHMLTAHPPASSSSAAAMISSRHIKKEDKVDLISTGMQLLQDSKAAIASTMLEVYDVINEATALTPKLEGAVVKQESKRKRRDYVCPTCKVDQLSEVGFHAHLRVHPLECLTCGKCFFRRANLALHIKTHLGIKNFKCEVCDKRFLTRQKLHEHDNIHSGRAPIKCTLCERSFRRYSNMVQHRDRHHFNKKPKIRDYVCHCGEVYHSKAKLKWHKETHDGKPKACQYCSDKFVHMSSLTRHVRRMHNAYFVREDVKKNENITCPICKQVYLRSNLKTHLRTHSGKRPYPCVICNKSFTTQWNLKLHRWTHMSRSSKPYKCGLCKGAFIRQSEYISHMNAHKSVRPYTCNYCGCQFIRKYNCQRHVKEHEMSKKYVCKVPDCGKSFHRSYYLSEHMKVHSGARPFSCNICGKTSSNKSNHNKHIKIHHAREPVATEA